eukprot:scaffold1673_cov330-Pavlova_lutheri.AAC.2
MGWNPLWVPVDGLETKGDPSLLGRKSSDVSDPSRFTSRVCEATMEGSRQARELLGKHHLQEAAGPRRVMVRNERTNGGGEKKRERTVPERGERNVEPRGQHRSDASMKRRCRRRFENHAIEGDTLDVHGRPPGGKIETELDRGNTNLQAKNGWVVRD